MFRIQIVTPAARGSRAGNRVTANRWAELLRDLGHRVQISTSLRGWPDILVALHARRSHDSVRRFHERHPHRPLIVALTGTDLYRDIRVDENARHSLQMAQRLVVLQAAAIRELPRSVRAKAIVVRQSAEPRIRRRALEATAVLAVVGHLRMEKDPFRIAEALGLIPNVDVRCIHAGKALSPEFMQEARVWMRREPRYRWIGELPPARARQLIADSDAIVISSIMEGGANVISEAVVSRVPLIASRISSSVALLGEDYEGFFKTGSSKALAAVVARFTSDSLFRKRLRLQIRKLKPLFTPSAEREGWRGLLAGLETETDVE